MAQVFVHTDKGKKRLRFRTKRKKAGGEETAIERSQLVAMTEPRGKWECLYIREVTEREGFYSDDVGKMTVVVEPVIFWGLDRGGWLRPITPTCLQGAEGDWALRRVGSQSVYSSVDKFMDEDDWREERRYTEGYVFDEPRHFKGR